MKISVKVKARSKQTKVERTPEGLYNVWVTAVPDKGRANEAVIEALSDFMDVPKSRFEITSGHTSPRKIIEIAGKG